MSDKMLCRRSVRFARPVGSFLRNRRNQRLIACLVPIVVAIVGGIWTVVTYVWPDNETSTTVCANQGIEIGGNVSMSKIDNTRFGNSVIVGPCVMNNTK